MGRMSKRKRRLAKVIAVLLLVAAALAAVFLFQIRKMDVYGNSTHSSEEIKSSLLQESVMDNALYLMWVCRKGNIPDTLPYLNSLNLQLKSPFHMDVHVTEKEAVGYVDQGSYVYFDKDGLVLNIADELYGEVPIITGASVGEAVLYQKLPTESSAQLRTILSLTQLLAYQDLHASEIRFGENMEITVFIEGVEVQMGQDEYLEEKVANLNKILPQLDGQKGTLHLESFTGRNETVSFTPFDEPVDTTGDEAAGGGAGVEGGDTVAGDGTADDAASAGEGAEDTAQEPEEEDTGVIFPMVFNSSGTLVYNVHISNGTVVDEYGNPVPGVTVNEDGNVVDAYMNVFDSATGELIQQ